MNYDEAEKAIKEIEDEYREKAESALKFVQPSEEQLQQRQGAGDEDWDEERGPPLRPIEEEGEEEGMEVGVRVSESQESAGTSQTQGGLGGAGSLGNHFIFYSLLDLFFSYRKSRSWSRLAWAIGGSGYG